MAHLTLDDFADKVGHKFRLTIEAEETVEIELIEATAMKAPGAERQQQFSIVFEGPKDAANQQRIYHLQHDDLGGLDLFLVPIFGDDEVVRCEAVFT